MPAPDAMAGGAVGRVSHASDLALLADAAREAGRIAMRYHRRDPRVWMKGGTSPVSEADIAVDRFLRETLTAARPDYGWLSEESVDTADRLRARRTFVVDPIDGTRAFIDGSKYWCVSVAVVENGRSLAGVLDCPVTGEIFTAAAGAGSALNGAPLAVRAAGETLEIAGPKPYVDAMPEMSGRTVRRGASIPSLAYRIALIAAGRLDATFIKPNAHDWDIAAADLVLREAGGAIRDGEGRAPSLASSDPRHDALAAGSGDLLEVMTRVLSIA